MSDEEGDSEEQRANGATEEEAYEGDESANGSNPREGSPSIQDDAVVVLGEHTDETLSVTASPTNPNILITGGMDDVGIIWDLELQTSLAKVVGMGESVSTVSFSHDGQFAAFGSENGAISIVFMDGSPAPSTPLDGPGDAINFLSWHPRGPVLLAGSADSVAYMWNAAKSKFMMAFAGHEDGITCGSFTSDGKLVVTGSQDASIRVWSPTSGATLLRIQSGMEGLRGMFHAADLQCLAVGSEGTNAGMLIASGCAAGDVFLTHRESGEVVVQLPRHEEGVESIAFTPSGIAPVMLATGGSDGVVRVWDVDSSAERCRFEHRGVVVKVIWHSKKALLVSASSDGSVVMWDALSGRMMKRFTGHTEFITDISFANSETLLASTSGDGSVRIYDIQPLLVAP